MSQIELTRNQLKQVQDPEEEKEKKKKVRILKIKAFFNISSPLNI